MRRLRLLALVFGFLLVAAACGDDSGSSSSDTSSDDTSSDEVSSDDTSSDEMSDEEDEGTTDEPESDASAPTTAGASTLTFDGEEIALNARGCYAEQQEVAGSIITLTAQAGGTNAAGEDVLVDFSRYAPGGTIGEGDDFLIDIGPLGASTTYQATLPFESVPIVDGVLTVSDATFSSFDDGSEVVVSVAIVC